MGSARSILFTAASVLMLLSGEGSIICATIMSAQRLPSAEASKPTLIIHAALVLIFSVLNIIAGINGLRYYKRRINSAVIIRLPEISVALCIISIILPLYIGTLFSYILILAGTGILIPVFFIYAAVKKSYK